MTLKEFMKIPLLSGNEVRVIEQAISFDAPMYDTRYLGTFFEMRESKSLEDLLEHRVLWIDIVGDGIVQIVLVEE